MTKIAILSDLHLRSWGVYNDFTIPAADIYVIAGDIDEGIFAPSWIDYRFRGKEVVMVPGNHEYYSADFTTTRDSLLNYKWRELKSGGFYDNMTYYNIKRKIRFICSTLWSDCSALPLLLDHMDPFDIRKIETSIGDFRYILDGKNKRFSVEKMTQLHNESKAFLLKEIQTPYDGKTVVVTHFPPALESLCDRFKKDPISAYFMNDLPKEYFVGVNTWICGHVHWTHEYMKGEDCKVICHTRGYRTELSPTPKMRVIKI